MIKYVVDNSLSEDWLNKSVELIKADLKTKNYASLDARARHCIYFINVLKLTASVIAEVNYIKNIVLPSFSDPINQEDEKCILYVGGFVDKSITELFDEVNILCKMF